MSSFKMSGTTKVKSLRDCLLKSTLVNFNRIFFEDVGVLKKHIRLPPMLFENIQDKSNEICWIIPPKSLTACLSNRDALNWVNIDLRVGTLTPDDLLQMEKSDFPIKRLSFQTEGLTDAMLDVIENFSSTIEVLEIECSYAPRNVDISEKVQNQSVIKFPKLKVLFINFYAVPLRLFKRFDFSSCSDSLKELCLFGYSLRLTNVEWQLVINLNDRLKVLKNLESLTVQDNNICIKMNSVVQLKNLRNLNLAAIPSNIPPEQSLVNILPKLENLTLPYDDLIRELNSLKGKTLNYVGSRWLLSDIPEHSKEVSKNFGSLKDFKPCLKLMEYSCCYYEYTQNASVLLLTLSHWFDNHNQDNKLLLTRSDVMKVEKAILTHIMWGHFYVEYCANAITKYKHIWSQNFIMKVTNLVTSLQISEDERFIDKIERSKVYFMRLLKHQPLIDYKKRYVALNPNSSISQMYMKIPPLVYLDRNLLHWTTSDIIFGTVTVLITLVLLLFSVVLTS